MLTDFRDFGGADVGMVLGKMMPPHEGHLYLVQFAARRCRRLYIVVEHVAGEPIDSELRVAWMRELAPHNATVLHLDRAHPQDPSKRPDFWDIWRTSLLSLLPESPDLVFASETYGERLASELGARFVPVDPARQIVGVSGTLVRTDPLAHLDQLPPPVRAHFVRRVSIFGPESTGKSTLAQRLARQFGTLSVPEYARTWLEARPGPLSLEDMESIAWGQIASEDILARRANRVLFCDTDALVTPLWSKALLGADLEQVRDVARRRHYHLTLLCDVDVPWSKDPVRYLPEKGCEFLEACQQELERAGRRYVVVRGTWDERAAIAEGAIRKLLDEPSALPPWP